MFRWQIVQPFQIPLRTNSAELSPVPVPVRIGDKTFQFHFTNKTGLPWHNCTCCNCKNFTILLKVVTFRAEGAERKGRRMFSWAAEWSHSIVACHPPPQRLGIIMKSDSYLFRFFNWILFSFLSHRRPDGVWMGRSEKASSSSSSQDFSLPRENSQRSSSLRSGFCEIRESQIQRRLLLCSSPFLVNFRDPNPRSACLRSTVLKRASSTLKMMIRGWGVIKLKAKHWAVPSLSNPVMEFRKSRNNQPELS